jgi:5-hydroxyisourate hydrolase-like protein (transthyretin family)
VDKEVLEAVDGVSFWTWKQSENHKNFDAYIEAIRRNYPNKEIIAGVYVFNGAQTPTPASVHHIIERAVDLYARGQVNGLLIFSAVWMSREKMMRERWDELALPQFLARAYYAFLGKGTGRVIAANTGQPVANALVAVTRFAGGKPLLVARKFTDERGAYHFGGWAGKDKKAGVNYEIRIESDSFKPRSMRLRLRAGESVSFADARLKR